MASVIRHGKRFDTGRHVGQSYISDGSFGLADRLDNTTDIAMASRPIKFSEKMKIKAAGEEVNEVIVAYDALAVVVAFSTVGVA